MVAMGSHNMGEQLRMENAVKSRMMVRAGEIFETFLRGKDDEECKKILNLLHCGGPH
jgi:hypothetical protein